MKLWQADKRVKGYSYLNKDLTGGWIKLKSGGKKTFMLSIEDLGNSTYCEHVSLGSQQEITKADKAEFKNIFWNISELSEIKEEGKTMSLEPKYVIHFTRIVKGA